MEKKNLVLTFSLIINGVFIVLCLFLALSFMLFGYAMNKVPENYTALDRAVVATVLAPTSLCFDNLSVSFNCNGHLPTLCTLPPASHRRMCRCVPLRWREGRG